MDPSELLSHRKLSNAEVAYEAIKESIFTGEMRPGERIVEETVARHLSVSRTPIREALHKLERENLVVRGERGMVVPSFTPTEIEDLMLLRSRVEGLAARLASERALPIEIAVLTAIHEESLALLEDAGAGGDIAFLRQLAACNKRFHLCIAQMAKHPLLERMLAFVQVPFAYQAQVWYDDDGRREALAEHGRLIELMQVRDGAGAEEAMAEHISRGMQLLVSRLRMSTG